MALSVLPFPLGPFPSLSLSSRLFDFCCLCLCLSVIPMAWMVYISLEIAIAVACCLGNVMVVWAVQMRRSLRQPTFCFVVSLAVADFLVGAVAVPLAVLVDGWVCTSFHVCLAVSCVVLVLTQASVLSLLAIAVDRYLRVRIPLRYKQMATQRRSWAAVALCWLVSCFLGFPPLFGWHNGSPGGAPSSANSTVIECTFLAVVSLPYMVYFNYFGCILLPLLAMTVLYALVFHNLRVRLRREPASPSVSAFAEPQGGSRAFYERERRLASSLALVLVLFAVCWMPLHIMNCALLFSRGGGPDDDDHDDGAVSQGAFYAGILLSHANSAVNPVVYALRIRKIREAYTEIWRQCFLCRHKRQRRRNSDVWQGGLPGSHETGSSPVPASAQASRL
ncbi:adenosine receptor A1 [Alosa pseudoharengus]|uniref:adenosine receptor A1 n=1 Tax=Alosa pseudoharengus TaxID=34774 RepID=UPI003F8C54D2